LGGEGNGLAEVRSLVGAGKDVDMDMGKVDVGLGTMAGRERRRLGSVGRTAAEELAGKIGRSYNNGVALAALRKLLPKLGLDEKRGTLIHTRYHNGWTLTVWNIKIRVDKRCGGGRGWRRAR
jgi:hypothetical protein